MLRRLLLASLAARRVRALWAFLAVTLGVGVAISLTALSLQVGDDLARSLRASGPNFVVLPAGASWPLEGETAGLSPARAGLSLAEADVARLKGSFWRNNILGAAPELGLAARIAGRPVSIAGTWFEHEVLLSDERWRTGLAALHPSWRIDGRWPRDGQSELAIGAGLAARLGLHLGERAPVEVSAGREPLLVTAIVHTGGLEDDQAWMPIDSAQRLSGKPGAIDRIWMSAMVMPAPKHGPPDIARDPDGYERYMCSAYPANLVSTLNEGLGGAEVLPMSERVAGEGQVVRRLGLLMLLLALAALTAAALGLFSTTTAAIVERRAELALMRALGASPRSLAGLLLWESLVIALVAGAAGWLLGTLGAAAIRSQSFGGATSPQPLLLPLAIALAVAVSLIGTLGPLRLALRLDPATVLRG